MPIAAALELGFALGVALLAFIAPVARQVGLQPGPEFAAEGFVLFAEFEIHKPQTSANGGCAKSKSACFSRSVRRDPGLVGVILGDRGGDFIGIGAEILLIDDAVLVDDEGGDAGEAIARRIGDN